MSSDHLVVCAFTAMKIVTPIVILHCVQVLFSILMQKGIDHWVPVLDAKNISLDYCKYVKGSTSSFFMDIIASDVKKYTNFLQPCPMSVRI